MSEIDKDHDQELVEREPLVTTPKADTSAIQTVDTSPAALLAIAVQQGADMDKVEKLMDLKERWEEKEAEKAYVADMAAFKKDPPQIYKDTLVSFDIQGGGRTEYKHASLGQAVDTIAGALGEHGFSHRWEIKQEQQITVTCIITHRLGHSEITTMTAGIDQTGKKNPIQSIASTVTYLERYTFLAATGIAPLDRNADDDGQAGGDALIERITPEQVEEIRVALHDITPVGEGKYEQVERKFLKVIGAESLERIQAGAYDDCMKRIEQQSR